MTTNYSIPSIIAAYGLGIAPHGYYLVKMMANAKGQSSNILSVTKESQYNKQRLPYLLTSISKSERKFDKPERQNLNPSLGKASQGPGRTS